MFLKFWTYLKRRFPCDCLNGGPNIHEMGVAPVAKKGEPTSATLDEAMLLSGFGVYNIFHMLMSGLVLMGMIIQCLVLGYVIPAAQCDLDLTTQQKGWLSAIPFAAIVLTSYFWGWWGDTQGRRSVMLYSMMGSTILSTIASFAPELISFAVLQFLSAIFMTGSSSIVYTYLGEFNSLRHRDKMVTFGSSFIGMGTIVLPCLAWLILPLEFAYPIPFLSITYRSWRLLVVICASPFALGTILLLFAPETPKFLFATGRHEEALEVVKTIYTVNTRKSRHTFPVKTLIIENGEAGAYKKRSILTSMKEQTMPLLRPPLLKWFALTSFVQFGIFAATNGFYVWFPSILNSLASNDATNMKICDVLNENRLASLEAAASSNVTAVCDDSIHPSTYLRSTYIGLTFYSMYIIVVVIVDFVAKKHILLGTLTVTGLCGIAAHLAPHVQVAVILFAVFQMSGACIGLMNAVAVELFPTKYRAMGICLSMMLGRSGSMVGSNLIGWFLDVNCGAGFYLFGGLLVLNGLVCLTIPNNKKKTKLTENLPTAAQIESQQQ
ncbi:synaptic vesicle glycoprotein 2C-like isoform X2 [Anticarsia gemmatalis]|uniref:synaptic vesicle glycoprotein 2C-like isoform X2 n=1 Tax=Anticarsia gemmatalis TaxID=129554 RepID=UPI003F770423